jgi:hypothetical protein
MEYISGAMAEDSMDNGKITECMEKESSRGKTAENMWAATSMTSKHYLQFMVLTGIAQFFILC